MEIAQKIPFFGVEIQTVQKWQVIKVFSIYKQ